MPTIHELVAETITATPEDVGPLAEVLPGPIPRTNAEEFVDDLRRIGPKLVPAGLPDAFNYVYWHLSRGALRAALQNANTTECTYPRFDMPEKVMKTMGIFGELYTSQLQHYVDFVNGDEAALARIQAPWLQSLLHPSIRQLNGHNDWQQFTAGMKTHIEVDLAVANALSGVNNEYWPDFTFRMHDLFLMSSHDLAPALIPSALPSGVKRLMGRMMIRHIDVIRATAWGHSVDIAESYPEALTAAQAAVYEIGPDAVRRQYLSEVATNLDAYGSERIKQVHELGSFATACLVKIGQIERRFMPLGHTASWRDYDLAA